MKAAVYESPGKMVIREIEIPEPKRGEVRVKLKMTGICGSDVHIFSGHRNLAKLTVIGHEGIGYIDKIGEGVYRKIGERVAIEPNIPCGECRFCKNGRGNICINKRVIGLLENGCFAEYFCLPEDFCWAIPDEITEEDAVCIEPMAVAVHALKVISAKSGESIAIIGLGAIGLLLTHLAIKSGFKVFVTEINESKLKLAEADGAIRVTGDASALNQFWENNQVTAVFECAGTAFTASLAAGAAPRGSEIVLVGLSEKPSQFTPLKLAREGISILPSIIYDHPVDFKKTIDLIKNKEINPGKIISGYFDLKDTQKALELAAEGNESKLVIKI